MVKLIFFHHVGGCVLGFVTCIRTCLSFSLAATPRKPRREGGNHILYRCVGSVSHTPRLRARMAVCFMVLSREYIADFPVQFVGIDGSLWRRKLVDPIR
ncbi:hypothetical protein QBC34DRAFT_398553 [Podospora aff. communis PSN243]|uniref:Secreted protein n=1 Tax=Podospora aff. communis PSN243 TaxID=3040156 RepID=A0AAV9GXA8_9PEZI|nr:hypothetical protein QBC34DRAFT_398553 [Podospora aff. communis PSN243]